MPTGLRSWIDFNCNGTISENYLGTAQPTDPLSVEIDSADLKTLVQLLDRLKVQVFPEYGDTVIFDIPYQSFWRFMQNPLMMGNAVNDEGAMWGLYQKSRKLIQNSGHVPHSYKVSATGYLGASEASAEDFFSEERHYVDVSRFQHRAEVIAATTYVEAMVEYILRKQRPVKKRDFSAKIEFCKKRKLLDPKLCEVLHALRTLRNNSAHEFTRDWKVKNNPFPMVSVPQASKSFMKALEEFIAQAESRYGTASDNVPKFKRYVELVAGEVNKAAKLESVITLGANHLDELDIYFG